MAHARLKTERRLAEEALAASVLASLRAARDAAAAAASRMLRMLGVRVLGHEAAVPRAVLDRSLPPALLYLAAGQQNNTTHIVTASLTSAGGQTQSAMSSAIAFEKQLAALYATHAGTAHSGRALAGASTASAYAVVTTLQLPAHLRRRLRSHTITPSPHSGYSSSGGLEDSASYLVHRTAADFKRLFDVVPPAWHRATHRPFVPFVRSRPSPLITSK